MQPLGRQPAARRLRPALQRGQGRPGDGVVARQVHRLDAVVAVNPGDLLDQIRGPGDIPAPARDGDRHLGAVQLRYFKSKACEDLGASTGRHIDAGEARHPA